MASEARPDRKLRCDSRVAAEPNTGLAIRDIEDKHAHAKQRWVPRDQPTAPGRLVSVRSRLGSVADEGKQSAFAWVPAGGDRLGSPAKAGSSETGAANAHSSHAVTGRDSGSKVASASWIASKAAGSAIKSQTVAGCRTEHPLTQPREQGCARLTSYGSTPRSRPQQ